MAIESSGIASLDAVGQKRPAASGWFRVGCQSLPAHDPRQNMRRSTVAISLLTAALVVSNSWCAYCLLDAGVTHTYQSASLEESQQAFGARQATCRLN